MDTTGIREALMSSHLFSGLDDAQLERVRRHSHVADLLEGESLFYQGDEASSIFLVLSGRIKLSLMSPEGKEKVIDLVEAGSTFAEALMFLDEPHYPVTATALKSGRVIVINSREFKSMLHDSIDSCFLLLGRMSARIRSLIQEIDALSLETGTVRTVNYLLSHAPEEGDCYDLDIAKSVIASRLSVKPETFSRILKHLNEQQIVTIDGRRVTIHDRDAMIHICAS